MKIYLALLLSLALVGCKGTLPLEEKVAVKYKYVFTTVPEDLLEIPAKIPNLDVKTATDKDAAKWMLEKEKRALELEKRLGAIKSFQAQKLESLQKELKIAPEDVLIK